MSVSGAFNREIDTDHFSEESNSQLQMPARGRANKLILFAVYRVNFAWIWNYTVTSCSNIAWSPWKDERTDH